MSGSGEGRLVLKWDSYYNGIDPGRSSNPMGMYGNRNVVDVVVLFWASVIDVRFSGHELSLVVVKFLNVFELAFAVLNRSTAVTNFGSASWNLICWSTYFAKILSLFWILISLGIAYQCLLELWECLFFVFKTTRWLLELLLWWCIDWCSTLILSSNRLVQNMHIW